MLSLSTGVLISFVTLASGQASPASKDALLQVEKHKAVWNGRPRATPSNTAVDGPLMGNGDMKVAIAGPAEDLSFYLAKNDFWRLQNVYQRSNPTSLGHLALRIPGLKDASYQLEQSYASPATVGVFGKDGATVRMRSMVAATQNLLLVELEAEGRAFEVETVLQLEAGQGSVGMVEHKGNVIVGQRQFLDHVDIPSGAAVALKVLGAPSILTSGSAIDVAPVMKSYTVNIGREQRGPRWGFSGAIDELRVYGKAFTQEDMSDLAGGKSVAGALHAWDMDEAPAANSAVELVSGKKGKAWNFSGEKNSFVDCGKLSLPVEPATIACWVKIDAASEQANYILSCGEWSQGISLGLSAGKLRFTAHGRHVESKVLPKGKWIHVGGTWDGSQLTAYVDGSVVNRLGNNAAQEGLRFTLKPGKPVTLVLSMDSLFKSQTYVDDVVEALSGISDASDLSDIRKAHAAWWANFWAKSWIEIGDQNIEKSYYRSLYHAGALSRDPRFPPAIFGIVTTSKPGWNGDYHLNYNHFAPFYALYSSNRIEQGDPQDTPMLDFQERGRQYAKDVTKTRGVLFPVGIGPLGIDTTYKAAKYARGANSEQGVLLFQQRSNAAYSLINIAQRWRTTYDLQYGKRVYPLVKDVAEFWEDYLVWREDENRYVILGDAIHEGSGQDMNPILSLGVVRNALDLAIDMSEELGVDAKSRTKWGHMLTHLSSWTTQESGGKTIFRYTEKGMGWYRSNTLGIQHIYPGNCIGLDSDAKWLSVAQNTIAVMRRWHDHNGSNSFFPAAVRVGYDPQLILDQLQRYVNNKYPNGFTKRNPHGIENHSTVPNTINEMLCMSHVPVSDLDRAESVIRVFSVWPKEKNAKFENIRCWGAFLVSSELKDGKVQQVKITSERGRDCTVVNPWPGQKVRLIRGDKSETLSGERFTFKTGINEQIVLTVGS